MFDQLEALETLARAGTMGAAGAQLRLTQSAISKRVAALEARLQKRLIERRGRRVQLTADGERLLQRVRPLLWELRAAMAEDQSEAQGELSLGVSESILSSWGARALAKTALAHPELTLRLHAHRSTALVERVRAGEYSLGLCAGFAEPPADLVVERALLEPMVIIPSGLRPLPRKGPIEVLTIEPSSQTWRALTPRAARDRLRITAVVESFACAAQMARHGLGHGLVPLGVARSIGLPRAALHRGGLRRPVSLIGRKSTFGRPLMQRLIEALRAQLRRAAQNMT